MYNIRSQTHRFIQRGAVSARLVVGLLIISLGAIYLVGNLGLIDTRAPLRYFWPAAFCAVGAGMLIAKESMANKRWGIAWLVVGVWMLAYQARWIDFDFWDIAFPLLLLFLGARLVQRAMHATPDGGSGTGTDTSQTRVFAILSGSERRTFTQPLKDAEAISIMSGIKLDLTNAVFEGDKATLQVTAVMGGIEVYAPSDWNIVSEVTPILGAYVDKRRPTATPATKTLFISGVVLMGGVEVKN